LALHLVVSCVSLASVAYFYPGHEIGINREQLLDAILGTSLVAGFIPLLVVARFSFGYLAGFGFYAMILGFVWISYFSEFSYDHTQARILLCVSLFTFLLPVLFLSVPLKRVVSLRPETMMRLQISVILFSLFILLWNAAYGVAFVGIGEAEGLRSTFARPSILRYATGVVTGAMLPYAFAYLALQRRVYLAAVTLLLLASFYPVLLNKTVLFAPVWLLYVLMMFKVFEPKRATILTLLVPMLLGLTAAMLGSVFSPLYVLGGYVHGIINFRMLATPSSAVDHYLDFFNTHQLTHFCQVTPVRALTGCPYDVQLGAVFADYYHLGNFNGSLFATEAIASVGPVWAPLVTFLCGLCLSIGNSVSARLPAPFIAVSSALAVQTLLNVPLSTSLLSNGVAVLFLLWYVTPEDIPETGGAPDLR
jgi:hypothetical protein